MWLSFTLANGKTKTIHSNCKEIRSRLLNFPEALADYNRMCKNRIIDLINIEHPGNLEVFFCHPGCTHADGFICKVQDATPSCPDGHVTCRRCRQPGHAGFCADIETDRREILRMMNTKPCPTCHLIIFKDGGCNHMTCSRCHQDFCWLCFRTFNRSERYVQHNGCNQFDDQEEFDDDDQVGFYDRRFPGDDQIGFPDDD